MPGLPGSRAGVSANLRHGGIALSVHIGSYPAMDGSGQEDKMGATATCLPLRSEARCRLARSNGQLAALSEWATIHPLRPERRFRGVCDDRGVPRTAICVSRCDVG
jgi:hypothetical protein